LFLFECFGQVDLVDDLENVREEYRNLLTFEKIDVETFATVFSPLSDELLHKLEMAVQYDDEIINHYLIAYLAYRTAPFDDVVEFRRPMDVYEQIRNVSGLKPFLLDQLKKEKVDSGLFMTLATFFKDDTDVIDRLLGKGEQNSIFCSSVIRAFYLVGIYVAAAKPLVMELIQSQHVNVAIAAVNYLEKMPAPEALPFLIKLYTKNDEELISFEIPTSIDQYLHVGTAYPIEPPKDPLVTVEDVLRLQIGRALLAYTKEQLMPYHVDILKIQDYVEFGSHSRGTYEWLVSRLTRDDSGFDDEVKDDVEEIPSEEKP